MSIEEYRDKVKILVDKEKSLSEYIKSILDSCILTDSNIKDAIEKNISPEHFLVQYLF